MKLMLIENKKEVTGVTEIVIESEFEELSDRTTFVEVSIVNNNS